ncbi:MAG: CsbD family protein [Pseudorhodoplanes sp.]
MVKSTIRAAYAAAILTMAIVAGAQAQTPPAQVPAAPPAPAAKQAPAKETSKPAKESFGTWTWNKVSGNWKRMRGAVKEQWGKLTHNEIRAAQGRREVLNGYIQTRYGIDREAADKQIDEWMKSLK